MIGYTNPMKRFLLGLAYVAVSTYASAQTATTQSSIREAYGARLTGKAVDDTGQANRRLDTRVNSRVNGRLATRAERYRTNVNPVQALAALTNDGSRTAPRMIAPVPQSKDDQR